MAAKCHSSKPTEYTIPGMRYKVNAGPWIIMMCQCHASILKIHDFDGDVNNGEDYACKTMQHIFVPVSQFFCAV